MSTAHRHPVIPVRFVTPAQMQAIDRYAIETLGIPGVALMENAGRAVFEAARARLEPGGRVVVCCGRGNNGGDGLVVARHLANHAIPLDIALVCEGKALSGDAKVQLDVARAMNLPLLRVDGPRDLPALRACLAGCGLIIDALLGTGLRGPVTGLMREAIESINAAGSPVIAVDIPSGLSGETGEVLGAAVRAETTVTLQLAKTGFEAPRSRSYTGEVEVVDIGIPVQCYPEA